MILTADNFDCHFTSDAGNIVGHGGGGGGRGWMGRIYLKRSWEYKSIKIRYTKVCKVQLLMKDFFSSFLYCKSNVYVHFFKPGKNKCGHNKNMEVSRAIFPLPPLE